MKCEIGKIKQAPPETDDLDRMEQSQQSSNLAAKTAAFYDKLVLRLPATIIARREAS